MSEETGVEFEDWTGAAEYLQTSRPAERPRRADAGIGPYNIEGETAVGGGNSPNNG